MKVIDLYNKIASGEETPKKIKYKGIEYIYDENTIYSSYRNKKNTNLFSNVSLNSKGLNDEVEIIEDTPKKIEFISNDFYHLKNNFINKTFQLKINEIINTINNMINNTKI